MQIYNIPKKFKKFSKINFSKTFQKNYFSEKHFKDQFWSLLKIFLKYKLNILKIILQIFRRIKCPSSHFDLKVINSHFTFF